MTKLTIIGGGLAGCEAAMQAARRGVAVDLFEMRPITTTAAHHTDQLGELVCSNSLRSDDENSAVGALKNEMRTLGSLVIEAADATRVPAGKALAVDRIRFAQYVTAAIAARREISLRREEIAIIPDDTPVILATGPLTSTKLAEELKKIIGGDALAFYDGIAPIVDAESLDHSRVFAASRYDADEGDYLNIAFSREEYEELVTALVAAVVKPHLAEEAPNYFEGCLPIEEMARRGRDTPRFGPMKPVGIDDPRTGRRPHAVLQLRREDLNGKFFNLVGFQTQLSIPDQKSIWNRMPGFAGAEFLRYGSAHRNTYLDSPRLLNPDLTLRAQPNIRVAGQISGVEGYVESAACGIIAGLMATRPAISPPPDGTVIGGLIRYVTTCATRPFQPMKSNWGVVRELENASAVRKPDRKAAMGARSRSEISIYISTIGNM